METTIDTITVNGKTYYSVAPEAKQTGPRHVVVVDRGWIFAGDLTEANGKITLTNAVQVWRWESVGFDGMLANTSRAVIKKMPTDVIIPCDSEIFRCPVAANWGIK